MEPQTGYALLGEQRIAYQVIGDGAVDLVFAPSWFSAIDIEWEEPSIRLFFEQLTGFARVIRLDRRGSGASEPFGTDALPAWESFAEDIACVMDAVGSRKAFVYADGDAGPLGLLFAATHPDRIRGLILFNTSARFLQDSDYPIGFPPEFGDAMADEMVAEWGTAEDVSMWVPSQAGNPDFLRWMRRLMRAVSTPSSVRRYMDGIIVADARHALSSINAPTLVIHPKTGRLPPIEQGRYLAEHIATSTFVELEGPGDVYPAFALANPVLSAIREFIAGTPVAASAERVLATVLFTDIVDSTERAGRVGDRQWRSLLDLHDETVDRHLSSLSGDLVKKTGDGILATFDGPGRAVQFASALRGDLARLDLPIRTGIHTGEIERRGHDIGGLAVHLGARIMSVADSGEILVSRTVKDLVIGSSISFQDRGTHALKGIEGEWRLYSVIGA